MSKDCIFCRILAGSVPSTGVYEDRDTVAFMDSGPLVKGHVLVIPRRHFAQLGDVPPAILQALMLTVQRVAQAMPPALGADGVNIHQANGAAAGQVVPHIHVHVVPRFEDDGHSWNWRAKSYDAPAELAHLAGALRQQMDTGGAS